MRTLCLFFVLLGAVPSLAGPERFAIVIGNNEGSPDRPRLWFAERDAERLATALVELGGFPAKQVQLLRGQGTSAWKDAVARAETGLREATSKDGSVLLIFYSGHAGTGGLELGRERLAYTDLKAVAARSLAAVKIVLVDACQSGALTQVKGSRPLPLLDFPLPSMDPGVRGTAYVASTAVGESAQESASLGGSFFSHHLEVALRGAADRDGDQIVTLTEAFRYTAERTVVGTAATVLGAQHPTYDVKMAGRGDVVLSDLRRANARLVIPPDAEGQYLVRGGPGILVEFAGSPNGLTLGLPAGRYELQRRHDNKRTMGHFVLGAGETRSAEGMVSVRSETTGIKGGDTFEVFAGPALVAGVLPGFGVAPTLRMGVSQSLGWARGRLRLDVFNHSGTDGLFTYQLTGGGGAVALFWGVALGRFLLEAGPELGGTFAQQRSSAGTWSAPIGNLGAVAAASTHLTRLGEVRAALEVSGQAFVVSINHRWMVRPGFAGALMVSYGFF